MANSKKKKSAARERYEKKTRVFSARLPVETYDAIIKNLATWNMSKADALKILADKFEIKAMPVEEVRKEGFNQAKDCYAVYYPCSVCGKLTVITTPEEKEAAKLYMREYGWGHRKCHPEAWSIKPTV